MDVLNALTNKGIGFIDVNKSSTKEQKTLIVIGVARGGTSLLAGCLDKIGIFTGDASGDPVYEDLRLAQAFENGQYTLAQEIIQEYDKRNDIWAFKRPASTQYLKKLISYSRNPVLLIVFRDLFSIANRNKISMKIGLVPGLQKALNDYSEIVDIISKRYCDMYLFSYDKVMLNQALLINELCKVSSIECTETIVKKVSEFIDPNSVNYLKSTRINKAIGRIDKCSKHIISGWAAITNNKYPVELELHVNGSLRSSTTADISRPDVAKTGLHPTGECGYKFTLEDQKLNDLDKITVYVINHNIKEELQTIQFQNK